ncbi:type IV secretion system DNA-binding domain-containing protein, partial [Vibrio parahaemolyticus]|nr:type IV secretion system DNA-binding domain-containing protein [Vibrio parahaemolyticus]
LEGTESASLVSKDIMKTAISIKSVLATYIKSLRFLDGLNNETRPDKLRQKFSITNWVQDDNQKGFLFLSSNAQQHASLRPLISMWLAIASNAILGLKEDEDRRIWVIMDEMPSLHKLPELGSIIAEVRKFGGCYLIGIQSYAQLVKTYGKNAAEEMFDLLNTRFFFRAPSEPMARISAKD